MLPMSTGFSPRSWRVHLQQQRDAGRLTNRKRSLREKHRIRTGSAPRIPAASPT
jgi:hypothetical protein